MLLKFRIKRLKRKIKKLNKIQERIGKKTDNCKIKKNKLQALLDVAELLK